MAAPRLIVMDADVFRQFVDTRYGSLLRKLKTEMGIQIGMVPEVEIELSSRGPRRGTYDSALQKATGNGSVEILHDDAISRHLQNLGVGAVVAPELVDKILDDGHAMSLVGDTGEAYTFAVAHGLSVPATSNDRKAIDTLIRAGFRLPSPILRFFDLIVLLLQVGSVTSVECEEIRKRLLGGREHVPSCFRNVSFEVGLSGFAPRLVSSRQQRIGAIHSSSGEYDKPLIF